MGHRTGIVVGVALLLSLSGCLAVRSWVDRPFRQPGERLYTFPEKVWSEYDCDVQSLPFFKLERVELSPRRLEPGEQFGHRFVYVLCPAEPTGVVTGDLQMRILHRGSASVLDRDRSYDLKPGRWIVDAFVKLPSEVDVGIYAFELRFRSKAVDFTERIDFAVEAAKP